MGEHPACPICGSTGAEHYRDDCYPTRQCFNPLPEQPLFVVCEVCRLQVQWCECGKATQRTQTITWRPGSELPEDGEIIIAILPKGYIRSFIFELANIVKTPTGDVEVGDGINGPSDCWHPWKSVRWWLPASELGPDVRQQQG